MSENIRGITFAEQAVTPADDAIVRRAILGDGILTGCDVSYSGSTLTMAAGYIIACGRAFQITAAQNWAVVDATSGFARLLVTLDLTKTATEETFGQIEFSLEYAASEDGFLALVQEDINLSGAKYQIVAAVVSLGTGGITGIVSKLERAEGGGLNFKVVAGLTQPVSATENTIWVKTKKMTGWIFDANHPENLDEGMVWISASTESAVQFNALKKNGIQIYPRSVMQRVEGSLVGVPAQIYQNGAWVEFSALTVTFCDNYIPAQTLLAAGTTVIKDTYATTLTGGYPGRFEKTLNETTFQIFAEAAGDGELRIDFPFSAISRKRLVATGTTQKASSEQSDATSVTLSVNVLDVTGNKVATGSFPATVKGSTEKFSIAIDLSAISVDIAYVSIAMVRNGNYRSTTVFENLFVE